MNGLVMYLPHGYEGQGPEHSSARIERFLQLCAKDNLVLVNCSTPASFFHLLRRHMKFPFRTPLIVFTPKSLLRHQECMSPITEFTSGSFQPVIDDLLIKSFEAKKIVFCTGKIYYDLVKKRKESKQKSVAIIRLEQLYPLPEKGIKAILEKYKNVSNHIWVQEEPANSGMMPFLIQNYNNIFHDYISREASATPATGFYKHHFKEQEEILNRALQ
jgi:2-oxoglutarate dehydrogenase E1 component